MLFSFGSALGTLGIPLIVWGSIVCAGGIDRFSRLPLIAGQNMRKLIKDGFVIKKPTKIHSRARACLAAEAKSKGRHSGYGALHFRPYLCVQRLKRPAIANATRLIRPILSADSCNR